MHIEADDVSGVDHRIISTPGPKQIKPRKFFTENAFGQARFVNSASGRSVVQFHSDSLRVVRTEVGRPPPVGAHDKLEVDGGELLVAQGAQDAHTERTHRARARGANCKNEGATLDKIPMFL